MGKWIDIRPGNGDSFGAYLAVPECGYGPGIVLCQEIFGVNARMREVAERFAEEGYVVVVPDLFWRLEPRVELGYDDADFERALALGRRLDSPLAVADIAATASVLRSLPECRGAVGALGYCLGGRLVALAAASGVVDCAVSYYGVGLENDLEALSAIEVPMVFHVAGQDRHVSAEASSAVAGALAGKVNIERYVYPQAEHAFDSPGRASFNASASGMAYTRTLGLFRREMGPDYDLSALWEAHRACEFETRDAEATMRTMVAEPYVNHVPTLTGGYGQAELHRFYRDHFIPNNPKDMKNVPVSRTVGVDRIVNEGILSFTHDTVIDWMLPGIAPTGKYVEIALLGVVTFRGDKLVHEHIYWDQASVLVQIGLLDPRGLPVAGAEAARKVVDASLPGNQLLPAMASF
jgi:carboxymethylenebutenolidase